MFWCPNILIRSRITWWNFCMFLVLTTEINSCINKSRMTYDPGWPSLDTSQYPVWSYWNLLLYFYLKCNLAKNCINVLINLILFITRVAQNDFFPHVNWCFIFMYKCVPKQIYEFKSGFTFSERMLFWATLLDLPIVWYLYTCGVCWNSSGVGIIFMIQSWTNTVLKCNCNIQQHYIPEELGHSKFLYISPHWLTRF